MTHGWPLGYLVAALGLFVVGVGVVAMREHLSSLALALIVTVGVAAIGYLVVFAWRKR